MYVYNILRLYTCIFLLILKILNFVQIFRICLMLLNFIVSFSFLGFFTNTLVVFFWWMILCNHGNIPWNVLFQGIMAIFIYCKLWIMLLTPRISCLFFFLNCITFWRNIKKRVSFILRKGNMWKLLSHSNCHISH